MKITIEGSLTQIREAAREVEVALASSPQRRGRLKVETTARRNRILEQRRRIRQAFDLIRHDPAELQTVNMLAKALGGSLPVSGSVLDTVETIICEKSR